MSTYTINNLDGTADSRFAVGKTSGTLYFVLEKLPRPYLNVKVIAIIGRGKVKTGDEVTIDMDELLPAGTKITIEV